MPPPGVHVRLDWMRLVGVEAALEPLRGLLRAEFGPPTSESSGAKWFRAGVNWHPGVTVSYGHREECVQLDVRGERLGVLGTDAALGLMHRIYALGGFYATRLDAAIDFVGQDLSLHRHALASCEAGELCRLRHFANDSEYTARCEPTRLLLKLGKRDSPVCGRLYDKGLETRSAPPGVWERLEMEFKEDRARTLAERLLGDPGRWPAVLSEAVLGAVDFRVVNGRSEIARRPRVPWWAEVLAGREPEPIRPVPPESSFDSWWEWARGSFGRRFLQISDILRVPPETLIRDLLRGLSPADTETGATLELRARAIQSPSTW